MQPRGMNYTPDDTRLSLCAAPLDLFKSLCVCLSQRMSRGLFLLFCLSASINVSFNILSTETGQVRTAIAHQTHLMKAY